MSQIKYFSLNGQCYYTNHDLTVSDIITYFNYQDSLLVLELNQWVCNKTTWSNTIITNYDTLEIISIVGGG